MKLSKKEKIVLTCLNDLRVDEGVESVNYFTKINKKEYDKIVSKLLKQELIEISKDRYYHYKATKEMQDDNIRYQIERGGYSTVFTDKLPKYLYHGSTHKLIGEYLLPKKCYGDLGNNPDEKLTAVYATDRESLSIAYAITNCEGIEQSGINNKRKKPPYVINVIGYPIEPDTELYIYKLSSTGFKRVKGEEHEYYSTKPVKPLSVKKVKLKDYLHYIEKR